MIIFDMRPSSRRTMPLAALFISAVALSSTAAAASLPLLPRQDPLTCPKEAGDVTCPKGLPANFCCPNGSTCISLAGDTTAICCPDGASCNKIETVACNVKLQDVSENPAAVVKTTAFDVDLKKCGSSNCCPFGYSCFEDKYCVKDDDQSVVPGADKDSSSTQTSETTSTSASTGKPSGTESPKTSGTEETPAQTTPADGAASDEQKAPEEPGTPGAATAVAVVIGITGLAIIACVVWLWYRHRSKKMAEAAADAAAEGKGGYDDDGNGNGNDDGDYGEDGDDNYDGGDDDDDGTNEPSAGRVGAFGRQISNPMTNNGAPVRNDFLGQRGTDANTLPSNRNDRITTLFACDSAAPDINAPAPRGPVPPMPQMTRVNGRPDGNKPHGGELEGDSGDSDDEGDYERNNDPRQQPHGSGPGRGQGQDRVNPYRPYGDPQQPAPGRMGQRTSTMRSSGNHWLNRDRPESGESINVFADPDTVRNRRQTAASEFNPADNWRYTTETMFGNMMTESGLGDVHKGAPYVPSVPNQYKNAGNGNPPPPRARR